MNTWIKAFRLASVLLLPASLPLGCVRLSEPDHFTCESSSDCASGEKCLNGGCVEESFCRGYFDCASGEYCDGLSCQKVECGYDNAASACGGFACQNGLCARECYFDSDCAKGFECHGSTCSQKKLLENGTSCISNGDCASNTCCQASSGSKCAAKCSAPGDACTQASDCASGYCCANGGSSKCSAFICPPTNACSSTLDCPSNQVCTNLRCVDPPPAGLDPGATCVLHSQCKSQTCLLGICRGEGQQGSSCTQDFDCEQGRQCCASLASSSKKACGALDSGCSGSIGDSCDSDLDCLDGDCNVGFCTKPCISNDDCGNAPWGTANACETNGLGDRICFPGCTSSDQCTENLDYDFTCAGAYDSNAFICVVE